MSLFRKAIQESSEILNTDQSEIWSNNHVYSKIINPCENIGLLSGAQFLDEEMETDML